MKKFSIKNIACIGLSVFVLTTGCKDFLNEKPISTITPEIYWKDKNDATNWMAGVYNQMQRTLRYNWFDWGEVRSDNVAGAGTGNAQTKMLNNVLSANDKDINGATTWTELYTTISLCSYGIQYLPQMIDGNLDQGATLYTDYLGQCYAVRSLMYFYGLRVWGRIPVMPNKPITSLTQQTQFPRSEIIAVKKQILDDITEALKYIETAPAKKYYMTKAAVYALQADVYMWFQEYDNALTAIQNVEATSGCTYVANTDEWKKIFTDPENSKETIFNLYWNSVEYNGGMGIAARLGSASNTSNYKIRGPIFGELLTRFNNPNDPQPKPSDGRLWSCFDTVQFKSEQQYTKDGDKMGKFFPWDPIKKAFIYQGQSECDVKMPIYRYADIMLLKAEALNQKERYTEALAIVNAIRKRVGYNIEATLADYAGMDTKAEIEKTILKERQYELLGEGKRWFDLCRVGRTYDFSNNGYQYLRSVMNPVLQARNGATIFDNNSSTPNAMGRILFPINSDAFNANQKLRGDQNPPYDE